MEKEKNGINNLEQTFRPGQAPKHMVNQPSNPSRKRNADEVNVDIKPSPET